MKNHNPRKGTETFLYQLAIRRSGTKGEEPQSPQGDGNRFASATNIRRDATVKNLNPRKGTETSFSSPSDYDFLAREEP